MHKELFSLTFYNTFCCTTGNKTVQGLNVPKTELTNVSDSKKMCVAKFQKLPTTGFLLLFTPTRSEFKRLKYESFVMNKFSWSYLIVSIYSLSNTLKTGDDSHILRPPKHDNHKLTEALPRWFKWLRHFSRTFCSFQQSAYITVCLISAGKKVHLGFPSNMEQICEQNPQRSADSGGLKLLC